MARASSLSLLGAGLLGAAAAASNRTLCSLTSIETGSSDQPLLAALRLDGRLGQSVALSVEPMSGMLACGGSSCVYSPPLADQALAGLVVVGTTPPYAVSLYPLNAPAGYSGAFFLPAIAPSEVPGDVVALVAETGSASASWVAVAELTPTDGTPRVRYNLTAEAASFAALIPAQGALYDPSSRVAWVIAALAGESGDSLVEVPLDAPGAPAASLRNASFPPTFFSIGATFCGGATRAVIAVGVVAPPSTYGLYAMDAATLAWRLLISWPSDDFYLSGLGQIICDADGERAFTVVQSAAGVHIVLGVDVLTGTEVTRVTMADPSFFVGALGFCPASFA